MRIKSPDPKAHPAITANYLASPFDQSVIVSALKWARRIAAQAPLAGLIDREMNPGPKSASDDALLSYAKKTGGSIYHPGGTCRMGGDAEAVVDLALRVNGVEGLRVIDGSVMPRIVSETPTRRPS